MGRQGCLMNLYNVEIYINRLLSVSMLKLKTERKGSRFL